MLAVVGLGNPGARYARTRHNAGFMVLDRLASHWGAGWVPHASTRSLWARGRLGNEEALLVKPQTFMNRSGECVQGLVAHLGCNPADLLVVVDDILLDFSRLRFRRSGSDGGHNGLASVLETLQTEAVPRLRLGVGKPRPGEDIIGYVLSGFGPEEDVETMTARGAEAVRFFAEAGIEAAMNRFNGL